MIKRAEHGGNVYAVARERHIPIKQVLDFSASINPLGPSPQCLRALRSAGQALRHYPDPDCVELRQALARRHRLASDQILIGNGSTELIYLLPRALSIKQALIVGPTFVEYEQAVVLAGGQVRHIHAKRAEGYRPPLERSLIELRRQRADAVFLCNPNSPTGQGHTVEDMLVLIDHVARLKIWTIVDETFIDYCEERSLLPMLTDRARRPYLLVLRSFTKFFGVPGLRLGYLVASPRLIQSLRVQQYPWSVNAFSQIAGLAALKDRQYVQRSLSFMERMRSRLIQDLGMIEGLTAFPSLANFLLIELPSGRYAPALAAALRKQGILIRDCSTIPGLGRRTIRVAIRSMMENRRLVAALRRHLSGYAS